MPSSRFDFKILDEIKNGRSTDVKFLVGPRFGPIKEVFASKVHAISSSKYLKRLIDENSNDPTDSVIPVRSIRIEFDDADNFYRLIEFVMLSGRLLTEVKKLEQCVGLAAAAKKFELDVLGDYCRGLLLERFLNTDNYWEAFDNHRDKSPAVYQAMQEFFVKNSKKLMLRDMKLFRISEASLSSFLQFPDLPVDSEMELVKVCFYYATFRGGEETKRELFRRVALPHLRLFTLKDPGDLLKLKDYLEPHESLQLVASMSPRGLDRVLESVLYNQGTPVQFSVQTITRKRKTPFQVDFLSSQLHGTTTLIYGSPWKTIWHLDFYLGKAQTKFELRFEAPRNMTFCALETMRPIRLCHFNVQDVYQCLRNDTTESHWQLPVYVRVGGSDRIELDENENMRSFSWDIWRVSVAVRKGKVTVEVIFNKPCLFRKVNLDRLSDETFSGIPFEVAMFEKESNDSDWTESLDTGVNIFKSISFFYD